MRHLPWILIATSFLLFSCEKSFKYNAEDIPPFEGLEVPAAGEGYQIPVAPFPVPPNFEREIFVRKEVGNKEDIFVNRFEVFCRPGTHHMIAYGYEEEENPSYTHPTVGDMRDQTLPDGRPNLS